jgi:hypothetical protein
MKKGLFSFTTNIAYMAAAILIVFLIIFGFVNTFFNKDQASSSFEDYTHVIISVENILFSDTKKTDTLVLTLDPKYVLAAFDYDQITISGVGSVIQTNTMSTTIPQSTDIYTVKEKPSKCENKACICLFKAKGTELGKLIGCKYFEEKIRFYTLNNSKDEWFVGSDKTGYPTTYFPDKDFKYKEFLIKRPSSYAKGLFATSMYLEAIEENNEIHILIAKETPYSEQVRYKLVSTCPAGSKGDCEGKHFDQVIYQTSKSYSCKYDENNDNCINETVEPCGYDELDITNNFCDCGGIAYGNGYCLGDEFFPKIFEDPLYIEKCGDYDNFQNCVFDPYDMRDKGAACRIKTGLGGSFWSGLTDWFVEDGCDVCPTSCNDCSYYDNDYPWMKKIDPCDCDGDGVFPDVNECKKLLDMNCGEMYEHQCNIDLRCELLDGVCQPKRANLRKCGLTEQEKISSAGVTCCRLYDPNPVDEFQYAILAVNDGCRTVCGNGWVGVDMNLCEQHFGY